jgi:outer membrane protein assembly factor BamB
MEIRKSGRPLILAVVLMLGIGALSASALATDSRSSTPQATFPGASGQRLFATSTSLGIAEINPIGGNVIRSFPAPLNQGVADGLAFDGTDLYYLSGSWDPNTLYVLNPTTGVVVRTYTLPSGSLRNGLAYMNGLIYIPESKLRPAPIHPERDGLRTGHRRSC